MSEYVLVADPAAVTYPVDVSVTPASTRRNRITCAFRVFLALPHILLVGGPMAIAITWFTSESTEQGAEWGSAGVLGTVAIVVAVISWFAIVFTGRQPTGLWNLASFFLHWRVRAVSYLMLLCDDYPPFGEGAYPAHLSLRPPIETRDRVTVAFRVVLAIPHVLALWVLGLGWLMTP